MYTKFTEFKNKLNESYSKGMTVIHLIDYKDTYLLCYIQTKYDAESSDDIEILYVEEFDLNSIPELEKYKGYEMKHNGQTFYQIIRTNETEDLFTAAWEQSYNYLIPFNDFDEI